MRKLKKHPSIPLLPALFVLGILMSVPSYYLYTSVLEGSNEVHVTAIVPDNSSSSDTESSNSSGSWTQIFNGINSGNNNGPQTDDLSDGTESSTGPGAGSESSTQVAVTDPDAEIGSTDSLKTNEEILPPTPQTSVHFGGYSFPGAQVTFTLNGDESLVIQADEKGYFEGEVNEVFLGENVFTFVAEGYEGNSSNLVSYNYTIQNESPVYIPYILLPPVIYITGAGALEGIAIPGSTLDVYGVSTQDQSLVIVDTVQVDADGNFNIEFDLGQALPYEQFYLSCELENAECGYSNVIHVQTVGSTSRFIEEVFADFTKDIQVNFIDFAFMREAFLKNNPNILYDLNQDGVLDLEDFSLLNYQWTL